MAKVKTHEIFVREIELVHKGKINVIGTFEAVRIKIDVECLDCGHRWKATPQNLSAGSGCPQCAKNKTAKLREKTTEQFTKEMFDLVGTEYTLLNKYVHCFKKVKINHIICDYTYETTPNNFLIGARCPKCAKRWKRTCDEYKSEVYDLVGDEYILIVEYTNVRTKVGLHHTICDKNFSMLPLNFLKGQRCPHCSIDSKRGENSHFWKGGISPLVYRLRALLSPWKLDSLKEYNYLCVLSRLNDGTLEVHHLNKNFSEIMYETFKTLKLPINEDMNNYTKDEVDLIREKLLELHYFYGLGVPLTSKLHKQFHSIYGKSNNTPEQFEEFKTNYTNNEHKCKEVN